MHLHPSITLPRGIANAIAGALVLWLLLASVACSQGSVEESDTGSDPNPVVMTDAQDSYQLGRHLAILADPEHELTIQDVVSPQYQAEFVPSTANVPNMGYTNSAYWVRLTLDNEAQDIDHWLLEVGFSNMHFIELYSPRADGDGFDVKRTGTRLPKSTRDVQNEKIVFDVAVPPGSERTYYVHLLNDASQTLPLSLWSPQAFADHESFRLATFSLYIGILLAMLVYNAFLFFSVRERSYLYITIVLACMIMFDLTYSGYLQGYFVENPDFLSNIGLRFLFSALCASLIPFTDTFLELKTRAPRLHTISLALLIGWGAFVISFLFSTYTQSALIGMPYAVLSTAMVFAAGVVAWVRGFPYARFYMTAWTGMLVAFVYIMLVRMGVLPSTFASEHGYQFGMVWLSMWWSFALADRVNVLKANLQSSEHRLSQILEGLPLGVVMYGNDMKPQFINQRVIDILGNPARNILPELSAGRTLDQTMDYFSFREAGSDRPYPLERMPVYVALHGDLADADDIEADLVDYRVPLEIWANPIVDDAGKVDSAVVAFQDITRRKTMEAELDEYRDHLERLVEQRTEELVYSNALLNHEIAERRSLADIQVKLIAWLSEVNVVHEMVGGGASLSDAISQLLVKTSNLIGATNAIVGFLDDDDGRLNVMACLRCLTDQRSLENASLSCDTASPLYRVIARGEIEIRCTDFGDQTIACLRPYMQDNDVASVILAPIALRRQRYGLLALGIPGDSVSERELALIDRMRTDIADLSMYARLYETTRELAATEERNRLARDLHDSVTQVLFSASLLAEVLPQIWRRDPDQAEESLASLKRLTRGALSEMRTLLLELRPAAVVKTPLSELLSQLTEAVTGRTGLPFRLRIQRTDPLPEEVHVAVYRIAQESLNNVVKHAQASRVDVSLSSFAAPTDLETDVRIGVKLVISDDGVGFDRSGVQSEHLGLGIMVERAADVGADLSIISEVGSGTTVTVTWPSDSGNQHG